MQKMGERPLVSIIILSRDTVEYTKICIESILKAKTKIPYELIIVDNGSTEKTREYIRKIDAIKYFSSINLGVSNGRNIGFSLSSPSADFVCFLDNDTVVPNHWIDKFVENMQSNPQLGIAGSSSNVRMVEAEGFDKDLRTEWLDFCEKNVSLSPEKQLEQFYPNGFSAFAFQEINNPARKVLRQQMPPDYIPGWCSFIRKEAVAFSQFPFDPEFPLYSAEDIDLSWNIAKNGYKAVYDERIFIHHFKGRGDIAKNPRELEKVALMGYARLSRKWSAEIIRFLSSPKIPPESNLPYDFGGRVRSLINFFGFFIQVDGKWKLDEEKVEKALSLN